MDGNGRKRKEKEGNCRKLKEINKNKSKLKEIERNEREENGMKGHLLFQTSAYVNTT